MDKIPAFLSLYSMARPIPVKSESLKCLIRSGTSWVYSICNPLGFSRLLAVLARNRLGEIPIEQRMHSPIFFCNPFCKFTGFIFLTLFSDEFAGDFIYGSNDFYWNVFFYFC